ncbi:double zinc ribbon domain-containing protein, partial [Streptosporangium sp. NPDC006013]
MLDLILPPRCAGCDAPGSLVCPRCAAERRSRRGPARLVEITAFAHS